MTNCFMLFSKHFQDVPLEVAVGYLKKAGIAALDLTVRPGGHVQPERVEEELPRIAQRLQNESIHIGMITTDIRDAHDPLTGKILRTAAALGITHYKLGYWRYQDFGSLRTLRSEVAARVKDLAAMNLELGIQGGFHNHSDDFFGASVWDIDQVLEGVSPQAVGIYFDPAHAVIEGGSGGWRMALDLVASRVTMLAVKDFRWVNGKQRYAGGRSQSVEFCPLEQGNTPWPEILALLKKIQFSGPISFHSEYQGAHSFADLTAVQVIEQTKRDMTLFRKWFDSSS